MLVGVFLAQPFSLLSVSKMLVVSGGHSLWIYTLLFTSLQLWGRLSASTTSSPILPAPELNIHLRSEDSVVLVCRAPEGQRGVLFMLYRYRGKVDSQEQQSGTEEVHFTVPVKGEYSVQSELFCCVYKNQNGRYSAFSPYLKVERQNDAAPTRLIPSFPPPVLSVEPPSGVVKRGDMLSFTCSGPPPVPQSSSNRKPVTFLLLRTAEPTGLTYIIHQPPASQVSSSEPQPGVFSVGPVTGGEEGDYTCLYQITKKRGLVNSTVSNPVKITVTDALPMPTLVLQQQTDVWHLLCSGSPAYPGAVFYLHLADDELPVATHHATLVQHQATFLVPVQDTPVALYHCKYSVLLGKEWSYSERSLPLAVSKGVLTPTSSDLPGVDLPLILGSISAVVLFLCSAALVAVVAYRKVKAVAREKKKRQEAQFWTQVHAKDHVVDLTLRRPSYPSQEWASEDTSAETVSRSPLWNSHSTFTSPIY